MPIPTWQPQHSFSIGSVHLQRRRLVGAINKPDGAKPTALGADHRFIGKTVIELGDYTECRSRDGKKLMRKPSSKPKQFAKHRRVHRQLVGVKLETTTSRIPA